MDWEESREFNEQLAWEEWWDASRAVTKKSCPACLMPMDDPDAIACEECLIGWDEEHDSR